MTTEHTRQPIGARPAKHRRKQPADWRSVAMMTAATFLAIFSLLAIRMQNGVDPAIGATPARQTAQAAIRRRLIIKRKVIHETIVPAAPSGSGSGTPGYAQSSGSTRASAPSYSAPAPTTYAPAPAPAPVTRAS